jgi:WD40 repeat protein
LHLQVKSKVVAHDRKAQMAAFNLDGTLLATTSTQGTVIRIFSVSDLKKKATFRRGTTAKTIRSLSFSPDSSLLALTS